MPWFQPGQEEPCSGTGDYSVPPHDMAEGTEKGREKGRKKESLPRKRSSFQPSEHGRGSGCVARRAWAAPVLSWRDQAGWRRCGEVGSNFTVSIFSCESLSLLYTSAINIITVTAYFLIS